MICQELSGKPFANHLLDFLQLGWGSLKKKTLEWFPWVDITWMSPDQEDKPNQLLTHKKMQCKMSYLSPVGKYLSIPSVRYELVRKLGHLRIQIIHYHEHNSCGFLTLSWIQVNRVGSTQKCFLQKIRVQGHRRIVENQTFIIYVLRKWRH